MYRDFWRLVFPPFVDSREDRATAMEARWLQGLAANQKRWQNGQEAMPAYDPTFSDWQTGVRAGWLFSF